jgi:hypothetical protein
MCITSSLVYVKQIAQIDREENALSGAAPLERKRMRRMLHVALAAISFAALLQTGAKRGWI